MLNDHELLNIDIGLDHATQLSQIKRSLDELQGKFNDYTQGHRLTKETRNRLLDYLEFFIDRVAFLSTFVFERRNELRDKHLMKNKHQPSLGERLFYQEYYELSKPYDKLKTRMDEMLIKFSRAKIRD